MDILERFLKYVKIDTQSDPEGKGTPSTLKQFDLARVIVNDMKEIGIEDAYVDEHCYVYGHLPASSGHENDKALGFIAHMDTSPDFSGCNVNPKIIRDYDGKDVELGNGRVLSVSDFSDLSGLKGRTLITTDGKTLLGADDKAGIAVILDTVSKIINSNLPHGKICIAFTPDEEIGMGTACFDLKAFGADFAYTLDGGAEGEIECENFNAASAVFEINGFNVHPGSANNKMINASLVAAEIISMLPSTDRPECTEGREGFFHLCEMNGNVEKAVLKYIIRDHDEKIFEFRKSMLLHVESVIKQKYGSGSVSLTLKDQYKNMACILKKEENLHLEKNARKATEAVGLVPSVEPIRGGTDGASLTFMGLPCPNLGTGGHAFHGPYEHITLEGMEKSVKILLELIKIYAE